jgi:hypothetical protein
MARQLWNLKRKDYAKLADCKKQTKTSQSDVAVNKKL